MRKFNYFFDYSIAQVGINTNRFSLSHLGKSPLKKTLPFAILVLMIISNVTLKAQCNSNVYLINDGRFSTHNGSSFTFIANTPATLNALGYNKVDGFLYAIASSTNTLYKISTAGVLTNLGSIANSSAGAQSGTITPNGIFYYNVSGGSVLYKVDLNVAPYTATTITTTAALNADIVYNPFDGFIYSASRNGKSITKTNPNTGATTSITANFPTSDPTSATVAQWIDSTGTILYLYQGSPSNSVVTYNLSSGAISAASASGVMTNGDAASCVSVPCNAGTMTPIFN